MGKILGKSALCFAGLAHVTWLVQRFGDWIRTEVCGLDKPPILNLLFLTIPACTIQFITAIIYAYVLFRLFKDEKHCSLIIALNGVFHIVLSCILFFFFLPFLVGQDFFLDVIDISMTIAVTAGYASVILSPMFKSLRRKIKSAAPRSKLQSLFDILGKSTLCLIALAAGIYGLDFFQYMTAKIGILGYFLSLEQAYNSLLVTILYSYLQFWLFRKYRRRILLIVLNAAVLMVLYILFYLPSETYPLFGSLSIFSSTAICKTAIITPILALIFRSVEKHSQSVAAENPPQTQNLETPGSSGMPVQ